MKEEFISILKLLNETNLSSDCDITDKSRIDIDTVRYCLDEMNTHGLIALTKDYTFAGEFYDVTAVTPKGKMLLRKKIKIDNKHCLGSQPNVYVNNGNYYQGDNKSNTSQNHFGNGDNVGRDKNINNIHESPELSQTIKDIQDVLEKLEQTYNTNTTTGKMTIATKAIEHIEQDSNLAKRFLSALEKGGAAWLKAKIINPSASFLVAALEDWQKNKQ